ncbi:MAG: asparaginase domain-containing protein, partial [Gemmatimonadota bacterium]
MRYSIALLVLSALAFPTHAPVGTGGTRRVEAQELPVVVVLSTGGTIASTQSEEEGGYTSNLPGEQLVAAVPGLDQVARIEVQNVANVGSTNMTPALWLEVS